MHNIIMHISVHNSCSLQHTELKINIEIQEGSLYLTTNSGGLSRDAETCLPILKIPKFALNMYATTACKSYIH